MKPISDGHPGALPQATCDELKVPSPEPSPATGTSYDQAGPKGRPPAPQLAPEHKLVSESESTDIYAGVDSTCEVLLCIVKTPKARNQDGVSHDSRPSELEFLRKFKPTHANVVRYFEITDNYIFMEHCHLGSLDRYLKPEMHPPVLEWTVQLCSALAYIHGLGWAHNQLYASNVLVTKDGAELKICDFSEVTAVTGGVAPSGADARGCLFDVYSLGILTWFMQHGGKAVPDHVWDINYSSDAGHSILDVLDLSGLQLVEFSRACWSHPSIRPTAAVLLERLHPSKVSISPGEDGKGAVVMGASETCIEVENGKSPALLEASDNLDHLRETSAYVERVPPPAEDRHGFKAKGLRVESASNVRVGVVKVPKVQEGLPYAHFLSHVSQSEFFNERDFLQHIKPRHPNIVAYFDVTDHYIFVEHCPLGSLDRYLTPETRPPVFEWTLQLCSALAYFHGLGFAHNQLCPYNILVARGGSELQICDFGTVTRAKRGTAGDFPCAPEHGITRHQTSADSQEARGDLSDVYALGLLTWFMQHGGEEIPPNWIWTEDGTLDAIHSHLDMLDVTDLQLAEFMRTCWAHHKSRPTSVVLLERLRAMQ